LVNYPAWEVRIDGAISRPGSQDGTAQMLLPLSPGTHRFEIRFGRTLDRSIGALISLLAALALLILWFVRRRLFDSVRGF
jgi:hypothetical protein